MTDLQNDERLIIVHNEKRETVTCGLCDSPFNILDWPVVCLRPTMRPVCDACVREHSPALGLKCEYLRDLDPRLGPASHLMNDDGKVYAVMTLTGTYILDEDGNPRGKAQCKSSAALERRREEIITRRSDARPSSETCPRCTDRREEMADAFTDPEAGFEVNNE